MIPTILVLLVLVLGALVFIALRLITDAPDRDELVRLRITVQQHQETSEKLRAAGARVQELEVEKARLETELEKEAEVAAEKLKVLEESEARMKTQFENLAGKIFEEKGKILKDRNQEHLSALLQPFKEQLESFRKRVDEVHKNDTARSASLLQQVKHLQELSGKVSSEANNLAKAIKGDAKSQGDWGELVVERIFEVSGLEKGREYEAQAALRNEDGMLQRPDFLVYLPGNKTVIVDAKVSLTAYDNYVNADDEAARADALRDHLQSVRSHVTELRDKDYGLLLGNKTLDFVIMCIPIEPAFQAALEHDKGLVYDLARSNVVITGPTTLMITLKLVAQIWRREKENRNAELIAERAGRMYGQVELVYRAMADARKQLGNVSASFDLAMKRLKTGRGSLVGRVEELRELGAKVTRQLPASVAEQAASDEADENGDADDDG